MRLLSLRSALALRRLSRPEARRTFFMPPAPPAPPFKQGAVGPGAEIRLLVDPAAHLCRADQRDKPDNERTESESPRLSVDRETAAWLDAGRSDPLEPPCTIELRDPAGLTTETWVGAWLGGALARKGYPPAGVALGAEYEMQKSESESFACLSADQPMKYAHPARNISELH